MLFWDPGRGRKGPMKSCPYFRLSVSFVEIGWLDFSETWHGVRGPHIVACDGARFFRKNPNRAKMTSLSKLTTMVQAYGMLKYTLDFMLGMLISVILRKKTWSYHITYRCHSLEEITPRYAYSELFAHRSHPCDAKKVRKLETNMFHDLFKRILHTIQVPRKTATRFSSYYSSLSQG